MLIAEAIGRCIVADACNVSRLAFQLILTWAERIYTYSDMSNYGQKLADSRLILNSVCTNYT